MANGKLLKNRAPHVAAIGEKAKAKKEVESHTKDLGNRSVHRVVLDEFVSFGKGI